MKIPFRLLLAANITAGKQDVRYYLNGVHVTSDYIESTDGHRALRIGVEQFDDDGAEIKGYDSGLGDDFIIPTHAISDLSKLMTPKERNNLLVVIEKDPDKENIFTLRVVDKVKQIFFAPIDGKYPDIDRIIPKEDLDMEYCGCFNWNYMADFYKASILITGMKSVFPELMPHGQNGAMVKFHDGFDTIGVLMPIRDKS